MYKRRDHLRIGVIAVSLALGLIGAACGGDDDGDGAAGGDSTIEIALQEWAVITSPAQAPAGELTFEVTNRGAEVHEFVILKTELGPLDLPTADDGSVDEEGDASIEVADEIEDIAAGSNEELTVDLEAGSYVLICNIVEEEDGEVESHYQQGMRTSFTVE